MAASSSRKPDDSDSRLERFRTFTVAHPRLVEAKEALVNAIRGAEPNSLIFVIWADRRRQDNIATEN
jgi:hypothetical protein